MRAGLKVSEAKGSEMIFNMAMTLRGKPLISSIIKDKKNQVIVELDRFKNQSYLTFDSIAFEDFARIINEFLEKGKIPYEASESCQGQADLDGFSFDLTGNKRFRTSLKLDIQEVNCSLILTSGYTNLIFKFNENQLAKIIGKFQKVLKAREALREAEKEIIIWDENPSNRKISS